jgi:hypothetical protein
MADVAERHERAGRRTHEPAPLEADERQEEADPGRDRMLQRRRDGPRSAARGRRSGECEEGEPGDAVRAERDLPRAPKPPVATGPATTNAK